MNKRIIASLLAHTGPEPEHREPPKWPIAAILALSSAIAATAGLGLAWGWW